MPRGLTKTVAYKAKQTNSASNPTQGDENSDTKAFMQSNVKQEPIEGHSSFSVPDLSKFKFEKKPHVKIEFEKASPEKEETKGPWEPCNWKDFLVNLRIMRANNDAPVDTMGCKSSIDKMATPEGPKGLWEPANWKEFLLNLKIMRANKDAPVDSMGCHMNMDETAPPEVYRYQSLVSLMLSSQTKDQVTFAAMEKLRARGLTIDNVLNMSDEELGQLIYPVGFWKTKVKYIKKTTQTLKEQYNGDIPDSVEKLCKLTGVGPKMAHICMQVAWNKTTGIGVDTHVHRISNRIGWVKKPTSTPEDTRKALESWLPVDLWSEVNHLMVGFGQTICTPISPFCNECLNRDICPSSGKGRKSPSKRTPVKMEVKEEVNSDDEFEDAKKVAKKKVTPKKVTPLQLDTKVGDNNKLQVKPKKNGISPKQKSPNKHDEIENIQLQKENVKNVKSAEQKPSKKDLLENNDGGTLDKNEILKKVRKSPKLKKNPPVKTGLEEEINQVHEDGKSYQKSAAQKILENKDGEMQNGQIKKANVKKGGKTATLDVAPKTSEKKSPLKRKSPRNRAVPKDKQGDVNGEKASKKKKVLK